MKGIVFILLFLPTIAWSQAYLNFSHAGSERNYFLYKPTDLPANAPLVFVLHGYNSLASVIMEYSQMNVLADSNGFAVCYPQGSDDFFGTSHWNAQLSISNTDDIGFLSELAIFLQEEHQLDPAQTFACGMSNGGFMSYTLACERPDVFKAIASVTGTMSGQTWTNCNPEMPIPVLQISGTNDNVVPMDGSMGPFGGWGGAPAIQEVVRYWTDLNGLIDLREEVFPDLDAGMTAALSYVKYIPLTLLPIKYGFIRLTGADMTGRVRGAIRTYKRVGKSGHFSMRYEPIRLRQWKKLFPTLPVNWSKW